jgi:hypothetical protein
VTLSNGVHVGPQIIRHGVAAHGLPDEFVDSFPSRTWTLAQYISSPGVVALGAQITRHVLIKYVANTLGTHFDERRTPRSSAIGEQLNAKAVELDLFKRLDRTRSPRGHEITVDPAEVMAVPAEVLAWIHRRAAGV